MAADYPGRDRFARLTAQEEKHGLLSQAQPIGTRRQWTALLEEKAVKLAGHRLVRRRTEG